MKSSTVSFPVSLRRFSRRYCAGPQLTPGLKFHVLDPDAPPVLAIRDLSLGGFVLETADPVLPGVRRRFLFMSADGLRITLWATAYTCRPVDHPGTQHVSEWRFMDDAAEAVDVLFRSATSSIERA